MTSVSTIIPAYNAAAFIGETLDSLLAQTYDKQEIIVVNDGSTDRTADILVDYGDAIRVLSQENSGQAAARNLGARDARGEFLAFVDADDIWLPNKLELQIAKCGSLAMSYTNSVYFGDHLDSEIVKSDVTSQHSGNVLKQLVQENFITASSVMLRADVFRKLGGFSPRFTGIEDWYLWLAVAAEHEIGYVDDVLVRYRLHGGMTSMNARRTMPLHLELLKDVYAPDGICSSLKDTQHDAFKSCFLINSHFAEESGDHAFSAWCAFRALRHAPGSSRVWKQMIKGLLSTTGLRR